MNRRHFLATGASGLLGSSVTGGIAPAKSPALQAGGVRAQFDRLSEEIYLGAASGTPLAEFTRAGLRRFEDYWRLGPGDGRGDAVDTMLDGARRRLGALLGATADDIAFVACTKDGERLVIDGLPSLRNGGNVVTNDLHFSGSLRHLIGLRDRGLDVRVVKSRQWSTDLDMMRAAIDERTALVAITLVSNVNGHIEPVREIADIAHAHGAHVFADVIQAAGIVPIDVDAMGIDFASGNGYKWLFGPHGAGYLYVRSDLRGSVLEDRLFPGQAWQNYEPWVADPAAGEAEIAVSAERSAATRYQPGHVSYLGYAGLDAGLQFIEETGVETLQAHSVALNRRLFDGLDPERYPCISPHREHSPIITFLPRDPSDLGEQLSAAKIAVSTGHLPGVAGSRSPVRARPRLRISPAAYNTPADIDVLIEALMR